MKVAITGGHLTPALAYIDYSRRTHPEEQLVFIGRQYSQDKLKQFSHESREVGQRGVPFVAFQGVRFSVQDSLLLRLTRPFKLLTATWRGLQLLRQQRPNVVLSFGGYLAVPIAIAAWLLKIPVVTHEQTSAAGFANQLIAKFARRVAISQPSSKRFFPAHKVVLTGNPLRQTILQPSKHRPDWLTIDTTAPLLLIMGGSQGSAFLNSLVMASLTELTSNWSVIHQCGKPTKTHHYLNILESAKQQLPKNLQSRYVVREWLSETDLAWLYSHVTAAVSRAGANTVQELTHHNVPTLYVPLPFAHHQEQHHNAATLANQQAALISEQEDLHQTSFLALLKQLRQRADQLRHALTNITVATDAAEQLHQVVTAAVKS